MYIESLLTDATKRVIKGFQDHPGIETKIRARGKFELYLHLELIKEIKILADAKCWSEVELSKGTAKKGCAIDLVCHTTTSGAERQFSVEVKMIVTNYSCASLANKHRNITNSVDSFIADVSKHLVSAHMNDNPGKLMVVLDGEEREINESFSLAVVYPMPENQRSTNAWKKHVDKMKSDSNSELIPSSTLHEVIHVPFGDTSMPFGIYLLKSRNPSG
jgi:hypothetical protein